MKRFCLIWCVYYYFITSLSAQCPDRDLLRERLMELKSSKASFGQQLQELLPVSLQLEKCPVANDSVRILLLQRIGSLLYQASNFNGAVSNTKAAIDLLQSKNTTYVDPAFLTKAYNSLSIYYDSLQQAYNMIDAIDSSIYYALKINAIDDYLLYNFWKRSTYALDIGDFQRCVYYSTIGETLTKQYGSRTDSLVYISNFFNNRMNSLIELNELETAEKEIIQMIREYIAIQEERNCGPFYNLLAVISIGRNDHEQALQNLLNSSRCNRKGGYSLGLKQSLVSLGYFYLEKMKDPYQAIRFFREALQYSSQDYLEKENDDVETSNLLLNFGNTFVAMNAFDSAFMYYQRSFDILGKGSNENTLVNMTLNELVLNPKLKYITNLIRYKGDAFLKRFQQEKDTQFLKEAIGIYRKADRVLTKIKATQVELQSKLAWRRDAKKLYEHAINACYIANRPDEAFYFFERSRAVLLNDQIFRNREMSTTQFASLAKIENELSLLKLRLDSTLPTSKEFANFQKNIVFLTQQKDRLLTNTDPVTDTSGLTAAEFIKKYRCNNSSVLELFSGDSAVYILFISGSNLKLKRLVKDKYDHLSGSLIRYVSDPVYSNKNFDQFLSISNQLYQLIFDGIKLDGDIIVSPDGTYFPFEVLITKVNGSKPEYLIGQRSVRYTYSAGYLLLDFNVNTANASPIILGMAPIHFPRHFNLASLEGSDLSLNRLISNFKSSNCLMASAATKNEFLNQYYKYKIVQLYTHGIGSGKSGEPVIYFADSALDLADLVPIHQPATRLVILSACETALGKYYQGEGVFSFNRAFAEAGVPSSMVNLWSVDNQSTYALMELFYENLAKGYAFDESLRRAKLDFIKASGKEKSLPYYWAATILAGQSEQIEPVSGFPWTTVLLISAGLAIAILVVVTKYARKRYP